MVSGSGAVVCALGAGGCCCAGAGAGEDELGAVGGPVSVSLRLRRGLGAEVLILWGVGRRGGGWCGGFPDRKSADAAATSHIAARLAMEHALRRKQRRETGEH